MSNEETPIVSLSATADAPSHMMLPPMYVDCSVPYIGSYSDDRRYVHPNAASDHRLNRSGRGRASRPPYDVNEYISNCDRDGKYDGQRYLAMDDIPNSAFGASANSRQNAWVTRWQHTGPDPLDLPAAWPCDTYWVRCIEEEEFQKNLAVVIRNTENPSCRLSPDGEYLTNADIGTTLPRPISDWYMFEASPYWIEYAQFECRIRRPQIRAARSQGRSSKMESLMAGWHETNLFKVTATDRNRHYMLANTTVRKFECSPIICSPTSPVPSYNFGDYLTGTRGFQRRFIQLVEREQRDLTVGACVNAIRHGISFSRFVDPRITQSNGFSILTPLSEYMEEECTDRILASLYIDEPKRSVQNIMMAVDRAKKLDWDNVLQHTNPPFVWYNYITGAVVDMPRQEVREYQFQRKEMVSWRVRVFRAFSRRFKDSTTLRTADQCLHDAQKWYSWVDRDMEGLAPDDVQSEQEQRWLSEFRTAIGPVLLQHNTALPESVEQMLDMLNSLLNRPTDSAEQQVKKLKEDLEKAKVRAETAETERNLFEADNKDLQEQAVRGNKTIDNLHQHNEELHEEMDNLHQKYGGASAESIAALKTERSELSNQLEVVKAEVNSIKKEAHQHKLDMDKAQKELSKMTERCKQLESKRTKLKQILLVERNESVRLRDWFRTVQGSLQKEKARSAQLNKALLQYDANLRSARHAEAIARDVSKRNTEQCLAVGKSTLETLNSLTAGVSSLVQQTEERYNEIPPAFAIAPPGSASNRTTGAGPSTSSGVGPSTSSGPSR